MLYKLPVLLKRIVHSVIAATCNVPKMSPNFDASPTFDPEAHRNDMKPAPPRPAADSSEYKLQLFQSSMNLMAHVLVGVTVGISLIFAFRAFPMNATAVHIAICVIGYQLLMAEAILSLASSNGWSAGFKFVDKRRAHWVMQILGSGMAIGGSIYKILDKDVHWETIHGRFALAALVFTSVSLVNGLTSLWAYELRGVLPGTLSKLSHICFGTVGYTMACLCLCYAFQKNSFINYFNKSVADGCAIICAFMTFFVIINPLITLCSRTKTMIKNRNL